MTAKVLETYPVEGIQPTADSIFQTLEDYYLEETVEDHGWDVVEEIVKLF
jgi:hypothetical protein